ncbi:pentapeptide MXKDX repeat protein [Agrobacterium tumefaciens]|uniref:pentapeptide MXKDX repeat protein n=1 Tax=Agrobacterium tumefaciens TaxID=358 RepID=UPI00287DB6BD|nr:pentapeptide MXKDX repeat protein [Agrobacterium tumefaciens]MDS7597684.1 pentapeptide MXKDX repeat protein [Agrobacterium tumefaciens]
MIRIPFRFAALCLLSAFAAMGIAHADTMKTEPMKKDAMHSGMSKTGDMKTQPTPMTSKKDCMDKAGMEMDRMKQADMMKTCDAMK